MSGHRNFKELVAKMSPERRECIKTEADELHREMGNKSRNLYQRHSSREVKMV